MTLLAPHITAFLQQRLPIERRASPNTCDSYAHAFRLLFEYASDLYQTAALATATGATGRSADRELPESSGNNSWQWRWFQKHPARSRSNRSCAIWNIACRRHWSRSNAFWPFPRKRRIRGLSNTSRPRRCKSILDAPDPTLRDGIRDRAMLHLCFAGGLRVSELVGLRIEDMVLQPQASVLIHGKGRKERCLPLWKETASAVRAWLSVRGEVRVPELFPNARNDAMTRAGFEYILRKHVHTAKTRCPTLSFKRVSPHVLRHTCALTILQATKDLRKVSLWLGHSSMQTTEIYTRADPSVKLEALESVIAPKLRTGRFKATDKLIEMLKAAPNMRSKTTTK